MRPEANPLEERGGPLGRLVEEGVDGGRTVWSSFDWVAQVDLEVALKQHERLTELVDARQLVIKTAALEEAIGEWSPSAFMNVQASHSGTILASKSGLSLSRATPLPAT